MQCIAGLTVTTPENCVWKRCEPSALLFIIYAFIVPILANFGLCANFINAIVFMRPKMTPSAFSYLAALSWLDCLSCLLITLTAFSRSILYSSTLWLAFDFQWQTPLFGITTGAANLILACVSLDRFIYLRKGISNGGGPPRFCRRKVARRIIFGVIVTSIIVNFPYFFVFVVDKDGTFRTTKFYYSRYYKVHNWFSFILLTVLPAIFLLIGNAAIIIAFRRWTKQSKICQMHCRKNSKNSKTTKKRYQHQMKLTISILLVVTLYMVGELPAHLTSRKSALNLLFGGDVNKVDINVMERLEVICIMLNSLQLSLNIIVYAVINPSFMPEFFICLRGASDVCFKIFCITAIGNCWRRSYQQRKTRSRRSRHRNGDVTENQHQIELECHDNTTSGVMEHDNNVDSDSDIVSNNSSSYNSNTWDAEESTANCSSKGNAVNIFEQHHNRLKASSDCKKRYRARSSSIFQIEFHWKRSSSFGEFIFDNIAMEMEIEESARGQQKKRHSLAF